MSISKRLIRTVAVACALSPALLVLTPAGASARERPHFGGWRAPGTFGYTSLALNPTTASALTGLGLTVTPIAPASVSNGAIDFPITNPFFSVLGTGEIDHSGGIAISDASTTVDLENFDINVLNQTLSADVSVVTGATTSSLGRVTIVNLGFGGAGLRFGFGGLVLGPVSATLNTTATNALDSAFGTNALSGTTPPLGTATVNYRLFGF